jgi:hypothetical protein
MITPVQVKRPDVAKDIRTLAALTGLSITDAIGSAVREQLALESAKAREKLARRKAESEKALRKIRRLPVTGPLLTDKDLYDSGGLPR